MMAQWLLLRGRIVAPPVPGMACGIRYRYGIAGGVTNAPMDLLYVRPWGSLHSAGLNRRLQRQFVRTVGIIGVGDTSE